PLRVPRSSGCRRHGHPRPPPARVRAARGAVPGYRAGPDPARGAAQPADGADRRGMRVRDRHPVPAFRQQGRPAGGPGHAQQPGPGGTVRARRALVGADPRPHRRPGPGRPDRAARTARAFPPRPVRLDRGGVGCGIGAEPPARACRVRAAGDPGRGDQRRSARPGRPSFGPVHDGGGADHRPMDPVPRHAYSGPAAGPARSGHRRPLPAAVQAPALPAQRLRLATPVRPRRRRRARSLGRAPVPRRVRRALPLSTPLSPPPTFPTEDSAMSTAPTKRKPRFAMRLILMLLLTLLVFGGVFAVKAMIGAQTNKFFDNMPQPAAAVSAATATTERWSDDGEAVGTLVAVNGTDVTTEAGGVVRAIEFEAG